MDSDWEVEQDTGEYDLQDPSWWEDESDGALDEDTDDLMDDEMDEFE